MEYESINHNSDLYSNKLLPEEVGQAGNKFRKLFIDTCENSGLSKKGRLKGQGKNSERLQAGVSLPSGENDSTSIDFVVDASDPGGDPSILVVIRDGEDRGVVYSLEGGYKSGYKVVRQSFEVGIIEDGHREITDSNDEVVVGVDEVNGLAKYIQNRLKEEK